MNPTKHQHSITIIISILIAIILAVCIVFVFFGGFTPKWFMTFTHLLAGALALVSSYILALIKD